MPMTARFGSGVRECLADDLQLPLNRGSQEQIARDILETLVMREARNRVRGSLGIPKIGRRLTLHKLPCGFA
jgi:hypothetical protein